MSTKQSIFDQAVMLFAKHGYSGASIRDICNAVGIKESSFYNHYVGKKELMYEILEVWKEAHLNIEPVIERYKLMSHNHSLREILHAYINNLPELWGSNIQQLLYIVGNEVFKNSEVDKFSLIAHEMKVNLKIPVFDELQQLGKMIPCNSHQVSYLLTHSLSSQLRNYYICKLYGDDDSYSYLVRMHETADLIADMFETK